MKKLRAFSTGGEGRNTDRKITIMRKALTMSTTSMGSGGIPKNRMKPRPVTLPTLETARKLIEEK